MCSGSLLLFSPDKLNTATEFQCSSLKYKDSHFTINEPIHEINDLSFPNHVVLEYELSD